MIFSFHTRTALLHPQNLHFIISRIKIGISQIKIINTIPALDQHKKTSPQTCGSTSKGFPSLSSASFICAWSFPFQSTFLMASFVSWLPSIILLILLPNPKSALPRGFIMPICAENGDARQDDCRQNRLRDFNRKLEPSGPRLEFSGRRLEYSRQKQTYPCQREAPCIYPHQHPVHPPPKALAERRFCILDRRDG